MASSSRNSSQEIQNLYMDGFGPGSCTVPCRQASNLRTGKVTGPKQACPWSLNIPRSSKHAGQTVPRLLTRIVKAKTPGHA